MAIQPVSFAQYIREGVIAAINELNEIIEIASADAIDNAETQLDNQDARITANADAISANELAIAENAQAINENASDIDDLQNDMQTAQGNIVTLNTFMTSAEPDLERINTTLYTNLGE